MPAQPKKPQDRKPKQDAGHSFTHEGKKYTLPSPVEAVKGLSGRDLRDVLMGGQQGEITLGFRLLEASDADQDTVDALYSKPGPECIEILGRWVQSADLNGTTLPES